MLSCSAYRAWFFTLSTLGSSLNFWDEFTGMLYSFSISCFSRELCTPAIWWHTMHISSTSCDKCSFSFGGKSLEGQKRQELSNQNLIAIESIVRNSINTITVQSSNLVNLAYQLRTPQANETNPHNLSRWMSAHDCKVIATFCTHEGQCFS